MPEAQKLEGCGHQSGHLDLLAHVRGETLLRSLRRKLSPRMGQSAHKSEGKGLCFALLGPYPKGQVNGIVRFQEPRR